MDLDLDLGWSCWTVQVLYRDSDSFQVHSFIHVQAPDSFEVYPFMLFATYQCATSWQVFSYLYP